MLLDDRVGAGGVGRYGRTLRQALARLPEGPEVVALPPPWRGLASFVAPYTPTGRTWVSRQAAAADADIVHGLCVEAPRVPVPVVVTVHDVIPLQHPTSMPNPFRRAAYRRVVADAVRRADVVVVPSAATAAALRQLVGLGGDRVAVVSYAVDPVFGPVDAATRERARRRFADGRRYVAVVATGRAHKNLATLEAAAPALTDPAGGDVEVVLRGARLAPRPGLRVIPPLTDPELRLLYGGAAVVLVCSHLEGYGFPAVEAAACGTPVVAGPGLGALSVLPGAVTVTDVTDPDAIAATVTDLLLDEELAARAASAGLTAAARLTPGAMATAHLALYRRVLA